MPLANAIILVLICIIFALTFKDELGAYLDARRRRRNAIKAREQGRRWSK